jgi:dTMP kinase
MMATPAPRLNLAPGTLVVFEGLDKAGKSTQFDRLKARAAPGTAAFAHMPSGTTAFTKGVYALLENHPPESGLGKQLAHLACHCENMPDLLENSRSKALVLDRWWWSTIAYGWYGEAVPKSGISESTFRNLVSAIWAPLTASILFLFLTPRQEDPNNVVGVEAGYRELASKHRGAAFTISEMTEDETHKYIVAQLTATGLARLG